MLDSNIEIADEILFVGRLLAQKVTRLKAKQPFFYTVLADEYIGLQEVGDGIGNFIYDRTLLGYGSMREAAGSPA